ncbi:3-phosphoshikimate 1-carboxyvinyltransferase [Virgibacillus oceani]|uniref:3-phosphoshikimate 1-carboxyvinyltransferase n=1 Tax=Virgibacillus oceani TaxID=1479511 RepID=A0A917H2C7_9BACI|nr:3-phosphoshikimate 1-carboxyvinyltransferase [Virgibacillus oceani]GGG65327.1 3-phosphoshikimate 1-carboxyvinyltransferase [Virgibacillus oceani]
MKNKELFPSPNPLSGVVNVPGDKSISHRAVMFGSMATGITRVDNFLDGEDCMRTVNAFRSLGVRINKEESTLIIHGNGASSLAEPLTPLYFGNSGTTARLMLGVLAALPFFTAAYGDKSLTKRPMDRVVDPLTQMGASFEGRNNGCNLPLAFRGGGLKGICYTLPVKSAQVKSAVLLAGLFAEGETKVIEKTTTRDHTENMLHAFGADITRNKNQTVITNKKSLKSVDVFVPGDISSAAFFLAAATIVPESTITLRNVGLNETRTGIIDVMGNMGAKLEITNEQTVSGERIGDITVSYGELNGIVIDGDIIPRLIDEIPVIALLATQAEGTTIIRDASELRFKETDRIAAVVDVLSALGAKIEATDDGMIIHGKTKLTGGHAASYDDHRIAMMIAIASLITEGKVILDDEACIAISYPDFFDDLNSVIG